VATTQQQMNKLSTIYRSSYTIPVR